MIYLLSAGYNGYIGIEFKNNDELKGIDKNLIKGWPINHVV